MPLSRIQVIALRNLMLYIRNLLVEFAFAEADFADTLELLLEIPLGQDGAAVLEALVVHGKTLDGELPDHGGRPFAELDGTLGVDLVADGDDGGEVVVLGLVAFSVSGSYSKFSNN